jgi:RNA-splicing ligase RtcB
LGAAQGRRLAGAHWGYGFPIGGVAAFDADAGGVVSAGGVGFDVSCGVRCLLTGLRREQVMAVQQRLADAAETAGLARKVARLEPLVCIKG